MNIFVEKDNKKLKLKVSLKGTELLKRLNINPSNVILVKNDEVVLDDELLEDKDEIKILSVISGG